jgi:hypothetical protein
MKKLLLTLLTISLMINISLFIVISFEIASTKCERTLNIDHYSSNYNNLMSDCLNF